jgi:hypothetical protein
MRKRVIQALVGLVVAVGLVLGPIAPGAMVQRGKNGRAPGRVLAMSRMCGWDHGGSPGG